MPQTQKRTAELLEKANNLPLCSGVYIMKDKRGSIIYVGKSRKLKNRVSQYFQNSQKNLKTSKMVFFAEDFEYIICKNEIEALTLENALIKQHSPKYNIRLKDAKSYPYLKITDAEYPQILFTRTRVGDKAKYFGPFSSSSTVYSLLDILHKSLGIPSCKRQFPRDIGKGRPCLYYQLGQCCGLCTGKVDKKEYKALIDCAADILQGNTSKATRSLNEQMLEFAENERFEAAAKCRDTIFALENLHQKQNVVASPDSEMDIFGLWNDEFGSCISCMYVRNGTVIDKVDHTFGPDTEIDTGALSAFLVEHYKHRDHIPREIIVSFEMDEQDKHTLEEYFSDLASRKIIIRRPERGNTRQLCDTVVKNAHQTAQDAHIQAQKDEQVLVSLANLLQLENLPERIEAYDISNIGSDNITAGMIVFAGGKPRRSDYRSFNIKSVSSPDDYASMREAISRRIEHLLSDTKGSFSEFPDLMLIDGGRGHVSVVKEVLCKYQIDIPVFGMVKDDYHKTRALCNENSEINIAKDRSIFSFIYRIQEEVHRFTVGKTTTAKRSTLKRSSLENIDGIGPSKAKKLLQHFGTLSAIKQADIAALTNVSGISSKDADAIYKYFRKQ